MENRKETTIEERKLVIKLSSEGKSQRNFANVVGRSVNCIQKILQKFKKTGILANNEGRARKKIMNSITERRVIHQVKIDPKISAPKIAASTSNTLDLSISRLFWQVPEVSDRKYFHRLYVNFSNCSTICGGLFWPRIKLFWIPLFGFNHFESPKTQQLVSEVGLNANNKAMEAQFQTLLEKLTASMNANMGEMKSELTGMNANMGELNTKLTNVNEQISANKEELKSDLKGIGDKLTTMDKKFEEMEGRIESVENKFENKFVDIENKFENKFEDMESKLEAKIFEKVEDVSISFRSDLEKLKQKVMTGQGDEFKFQAPYSKPSIKLSTYDGKSWQVYKTQFSIVADANQWDSQTKACQLAASLRADAADILQTLPETQRLDFDALVNALELRFRERNV
ncbi:gag-Pol polyprotein [Trichonephila clavipes]|nr:gag-Pol polyprotein [Trichonephila clavipes]